MVRRRIGGEPLEYVLGWAELRGVRIAVDRGVFVPRRRSELLAREASSLAHPGAVVVDLCCGSGALGMVVADAVGQLELYATDLDPAAVRCARRNLAPHGGKVFEGNLFEPLPEALRGRIDLVVANAPYVPTESIAFMPREAREWEPSLALDGGTDGLEVHRRVARQASDWLGPGGHLLIETSERQAPPAAELFTRHGLEARVVRCEALDATVIIGLRAPTSSSRRAG